MSGPLKVVAVDDEPLALRRLRVLLREMDGVELVGEAGGCDDGLEAIARLHPQVLLLDIQMRDGTGFDLIERLSADPMPAIVFVSAFDHYGVRAFEASIADYVLKPVQPERLRAALARARRRIEMEDAEQRIEELKAVVAALRESGRQAEGSGFETDFWIRKSAGGFARVPVDRVQWVSSEDDYVRLHTPDSSYLMRGSIRSLESRVDPAAFVRIHRKTLVKKSAIQEVRSPRIGRVEVLLQSGEKLSAGRVYAKQLRQVIAERAA